MGTNAPAHAHVCCITVATLLSIAFTPKPRAGPGSESSVSGICGAFFQLRSRGGAPAAASGGEACAEGGPNEFDLGWLEVASM